MSGDSGGLAKVQPMDAKIIPAEWCDLKDISDLYRA